MEHRGLAAYSRYLAPGQVDPTYRFPSLRNGDDAYDIILKYRDRFTYCCFGFRPERTCRI